MPTHRNEVRTGILVVVTSTILIALLITLGAPGFLRNVKTYRIYFDDAAGIRPGAPVHIAGRQVGQVTRLYSPVPIQMRPQGNKNLEAMVEVSLDSDARIYRSVNVRLLQFGLMDERVIDFSEGDESSGLAPDGTAFVGRRVASFSEVMPQLAEMLEPVTEQAIQALDELQRSASHLARLTAPDSDLVASIANFKEVSGNVKKLTSQLAQGNDLRVILRNFRSASSELNEVVASAHQFTDTIKREPWRLIWPSTKRYPDEENSKELPQEKSK